MRLTTLVFVFSTTLFPSTALAQQTCPADGATVKQACKEAFGWVFNDAGEVEKSGLEVLAQCDQCAGAATSLCTLSKPPGSFSVLPQCKIRTTPGGCAFQQLACISLCKSHTPGSIATGTPAKPGLIEDFEKVEACVTGCTAADSCKVVGTPTKIPVEPNVFNPHGSHTSCIDAGDQAHSERVTAGEASNESHIKRLHSRLKCFKFFGPEKLGGKFGRATQ
jgi:hypothetical protein